MIVPIRCGEVRNGIGSVFSDRMVSILDDVPVNAPSDCGRLLLVAAGSQQVHRFFERFLMWPGTRTAALPFSEGAAANRCGDR
jgi:hypothetical protein